MRILILFFFILSISVYAQDKIEKVSLQLNWKYQFEYAGFIIAKEKGYYKDIGFDVELKEFNNNTKTMDDILSNKTTFTLSDNLFLIERQDEDIVLLANYLKESPLILATSTSIKHPKDLENKTFMSSPERILNTPLDFMFKHLQVDYKKINFMKNSFQVNDLINNNADAIEVYRSNELFELENKNVPYNILDPKDYGFNSGAINMFTLQDNIDKYGKNKIQSFIEATNKGWRYALNNPNEVIYIIHSKYNQSLKKSMLALEFEAREIKKLFLLNQFEIGTINKETIYRWFDILNNYGLIKNNNRYDSFLFNEKWKEKEVDYTLLWQVLSVVFILSLFLIYRHYDLKKQLQLFETFFEDSSDGILIIKNNHYIKCNQQAVNILGYQSKKEMLTLHPKDISPKIQPDGKLSSEKAEEMISLSSNNHGHQFEWIHTRSSGENFWTEVTLTPMTLNGEKVTHVIWRDISEKKRQDEILIQQAKLVSMGEMIGNIAHQWRQPLSVISMGATGMKIDKEMGLLDDNMFYSTCDKINNNAQYLSKTIDDFRSFIKGERVKKLFSLTGDINSFLHLVEGTIKNNNIKVITNLDDSININGYENELTQCFINIFNNSKDALINSKIEDKFIFISSKQTNDNVYITFKDNGGGIPVNILPKVFEPYFTTKDKTQGTGLGLHMTYNLIVDGMNGSIDARNVSYEYDGKYYSGAEFTISLPIS